MFFFFARVSKQTLILYNVQFMILPLNNDFSLVRHKIIRLLAIISWDTPTPSFAGLRICTRVKIISNYDTSQCIIIPAKLLLVCGGGGKIKSCARYEVATFWLALLSGDCPYSSTDRCTYHQSVIVEGTVIEGVLPSSLVSLPPPGEHHTLLFQEGGWEGGSILPSIR